MKKEAKKRTLSALLCVTMVVSLYSTFTFADDVDGETLGNGDGYTTEQNGGDSSQDTLGGGSASDDGDGGVNLCGEDEKDEGKDDEGGDPADYLEFDSTTGTITGLKSGVSVTDIVIPVQIDGTNVVAIGESAFCNNTSLTSVTFEEGSQVKTIGKNAFRETSNLTSIAIPDSVMTIDEWAFVLSGITSVTFGDDSKLRSLYQYAFGDCHNLTSITIPDSVTWVGDYIFYQCTGLTDATIGAGLKSIGRGMFIYCSSLNNVVIPKTVTKICRDAFYKTGLTDITLPDSIQTIEMYAFGDCESLKSVTLPNKLKSISQYTFCDCESLTSIEIPDSVTSIDQFAFARCYYLADVKIGTGVKSIANSAFNSCQYALKSIVIPDNVTSIDKTAFIYTYKLADIYVLNESGSISGAPWKDNRGTANVHWLGKKPSADFDYASEKLNGLEYGVTYMVNGTEVEPAEDGTVAIEDDWYDSEITIKYEAYRNKDADDYMQKLVIPARPAAPTSVSFVNESKAGACDGKITGVSSAMEYKAADATEWMACDGDTVTGLPAGTYLVRTKATDGAFASDPVTKVIGLEYETTVDDLKIDLDSDAITGLVPGKDYVINGETVTATSDGSIDIDDSWYGTDITITEKGTSTGAEGDAMTITVPAKAEKPTGVTFVNESKAGAGDGKITGVSTDMEYRVNGAAIWTPCTGDTVTGLAPGKYEVRIKSINGKFASDPVSGTVGTTVSGDTTGGAGGSGGSGSGSGSSGSDTTPVNPDPVTPVNPDPVTPVNPDPVTPVNPDPVTPVNPDQGGTDQSNGGNAGNGGSTSGTSGSYSSGSDDDDDDSYSINNNKKPGSQSGSTTNGTTNGSAANAGSQNANGTTTNGQNNGSTTGNTTATITNGSGISQTVKDNLSNALDSILEMDGNIQTGPYVRSDSDDISVQIPDSLQKSGRNFYLMTAKDNGDIVVLPNDSTEDDMFEAEGEADTDYQMLFEDGDTPLASMITESGVLDTSAAAGCINHGVGLGLALIGLAAAALLARMGKKYFWAASAAGLALALVASATGSCSLDWICFAGEAVVTVAATAALMLKKANVKEQ